MFFRGDTQRMPRKQATFYFKGEDDPLVFEYRVSWFRWLLGKLRG